VTAASLSAVLTAAAVWLCVRPASPPRPEPRRRGHDVRLVAPVACVVAVCALSGGAEAAAVAVVLVASAWGGHWLWCQRTVARAVVETQERVLECCDLLASELASGQPPDSALARAGETWPSIAPVAQSHALGGDVPSALRRAAQSPGAEGLALVAAAWHVSHRTGHGLSDALVRVAQTLRDARATDRVIRSELASARATARLVAALPVVALAIGAGSGGDPLGFLVGTPLGIACLAAGLGLGLAGLGWIERIAAGIGR
jgi:tight adherence protein B